MPTKNTAIELINANKEKLKAVGLRRDIAYDNWRNGALMLVQDTPDLMKCTETKGGQISLVRALTAAAVTRLPLHPTLGYASIIPRYSQKKKEWHASYQLQKNGMVKLASDAAYTVDSFTLHENDSVEVFEHGQLSDRLVIKPALKERGPVIGYFARALQSKRDKQTLRVHYMTLGEVLDHAIKTASSYDVRELLAGINRENDIYAELGAIMANKNIEYNLRQASWIKSFHGMGEKTVVKGLLGKPCFSDILNVAANLEEAQENTLDDANVITVEVVNQGAVDTKRKLEDQNQKKKTAQNKNQTKNKSASQSEPADLDEVPPPETPYE